MLIETQGRVLKALVGVMVAIQIALVVSSYVLASRNGYIELPKIYLSVAFRQDPGRSIAAFILPITAILFGLLIGQRLWYLYALHRRVTEWRLIVSAIVALICAVVGMIGVGAVSLDVSKQVHWVAAAMLFGSSTLLMILLTIMDRRMRIVQPKWLFATKVMFAILTCVSLVMMGASSFFSFLAASIFELIMAAVLMFYVVSLAHNSSFPLIAAEKVPKSPRPIGREVDDQL